jgi:hypothetical protein
LKCTQYFDHNTSRDPLGKTKIRWEDSTTSNLRKTGYKDVDLIHMAQNRVQREGYVNTVILKLHKAKEFFHLRTLCTMELINNTNYKLSCNNLKNLGINFLSLKWNANKFHGEQSSLRS